MDQIDRILSMYDRLKAGHSLSKKEEAFRFQISEKTIQRDLKSIRRYVETEKQNEYVEYDRLKKAYVLKTDQSDWFSNEEIYAVLKVLIESRAFPKESMDNLIEKFICFAPLEKQITLNDMLLNEKHHYVELNHKKDLIERLWQLSMAIRNKYVITINYLREMDAHANERKVKPVGIVFSEYYFYLIAYQFDREFEFPTVYRIDRIEEFTQTALKFKVPYKDRFQEGEFRKRVQFMYTGELLKVKFKFTGPSPQAVLDRLPTATIIETLDGSFIFEAEVFGKGIKMWILSQGEFVEVLEPKELRDEFAKVSQINYEKYVSYSKSDG